jgi:hypothetical protein
MEIISLGEGISEMNTASEEQGLDNINILWKGQSIAKLLGMQTSMKVDLIIFIIILDYHIKFFIFDLNKYNSMWFNLIIKTHKMRETFY